MEESNPQPPKAVVESIKQQLDELFEVKGNGSGNRCDYMKFGPLRSSPKYLGEAITSLSARDGDEKIDEIITSLSRLRKVLLLLGATCGNDVLLYPEKYPSFP